VLPASEQAPADSQANINGTTSRAERPLSRSRFVASASQGQIAGINIAAIRSVTSLQYKNTAGKKHAKERMRQAVLYRSRSSRPRKLRNKLIQFIIALPNGMASYWSRPLIGRFVQKCLSGITETLPASIKTKTTKSAG
jgi:hypothetical protein